MPKSAYFKISDAKGDTSTVTVYVPDTTTFAQLEEFAAKSRPVEVECLLGGSIEIEVNVNFGHLVSFARYIGQIFYILPYWSYYFNPDKYWMKLTPDQ